MGVRTLESSWGGDAPTARLQAGLEESQCVDGAEARGTEGIGGFGEHCAGPDRVRGRAFDTGTVDPLGDR